MRRLHLPILVSLLATCVYGPAVRAAATMSASEASPTLFRWSFPQKGAVGDWTFRRGILSYDGQSNAALFAGYTPVRGTRFSVRATIRGVGPGAVQARLNGFGLVVRQRPQDPHTSIAGGSFFSPDPADNNPELYWNNDTVGGAAFLPGTAWHAYRLDVQNSQYTLAIDGKTMVRYTIADYLNPTRVGIFSRFYRIQVMKFSVVRLTANPGPGTASPPLKRFNLALAELPTGTYFQPLTSHYSTLEETAQERKVSVASLVAAGRISAHEVDYFPWGRDLTDLYSGITAFRTPANARDDLRARLNAFQTQFGGFDNFRLLPSQPVGDNSAGIEFTFSSGGDSFTLVALLFSRGPDTALVRTAFYTNSMSDAQKLETALQLARTIDAKFQAG